MVHSFTYTDSSPLSVRFNVPRAPMMSDTSVQSLTVSNASPKRPFSRYNWICPDSSCSVKNANLPNTRRSMIRPATATSLAASSSPSFRFTAKVCNSVALCVGA